MNNKKEAIVTKTERIDPKFYKELEEIIEYRYKNGIDKKKKPVRYITGLIIRNGFWENIKEEIKEFNENGE